MKRVTHIYVWSLTLLGACMLFSGCSSDNKASDENMLANSLDSSSEKYSKISDEAIGEIIKSIPSPLEISMLIKESGNAYDSKILNPENNYSKYNSNFKK